MLNKKLIKASAIENGSATEKANAPKEKKICKSSITDFIKILFSQLFGTIKLNPNNRGGEKMIDWKRIHEIAYSVAYLNTSWLLMPLIVDTQTKMLIDGHNTFLAMKELYDKYDIDVEAAIMWITLPKWVSVDEATALFNNKRAPWKLANYIMMYALKGNKNYVNLGDMATKLGGVFVKDNGEIKWRYAAALGGRNFQDALKDGNYVLTDKMMDEQTKLGKMVNALLEKAGQTNTGPWVEPFVIACVSVLGGMSQKATEIKFNHLMNNIQNVVFDGTLSTLTWKGRLMNA